MITFLSFTMLAMSSVSTDVIPNTCSGSKYELLEIKGAKVGTIYCQLTVEKGCRDGQLIPHFIDNARGYEKLLVDGRLVKTPKNYLTPQVTLRWESPKRKETPMRNLTGFVIHIRKYFTEYNSYNDICFLLNLSRTQFNEDDRELVFIKKLVKFPGGMDYHYSADVYTLPFTPYKERNTRFYSLQAVYDQPQMKPMDWSTFIIYDKLQQTVPANLTLWFKLADRRFRFTGYVVSLISVDDADNVVTTCTLSTLTQTWCPGLMYNLPSENQTMMRVSVLTQNVGKYFMEIRPDDEHPYVAGKCVCTETVGSKILCGSCLTTRSAVFTLEAVPVKDEPVSAVPISQAENYSLEYILPPVVGIVIALLLLGCVYWLLGNKVQSDQCPYSLVRKRNQSSSNNNQGTNTKILLISSDDDKDHEKRSDRCARCLNSLRGVDVAYLPWATGVPSGNGSQWISDRVGWAHYIVVIISPKASEVFNESTPLTNNTYSFALSHLRTIISENLHRYRFVVFDKINPDFFINYFYSISPYNFPRDLEKLVRSMNILVETPSFIPLSIAVESFTNCDGDFENFMSETNSRNLEVTSIRRESCVTYNFTDIHDCDVQSGLIPPSENSYSVHECVEQLYQITRQTELNTSRENE